MGDRTTGAHRGHLHSSLVKSGLIHVGAVLAADGIVLKLL